MNIKRMPAHITRITDLSPTAREITLALPESLGFIPGAFVNTFLTDAAGVRTRRAYSISSDSGIQDEITLSIRKGEEGGMSRRFWEEGISDAPLEIMGPLGLNTTDKITGTRIFLFAFGIGVSVIKGILPELLRRTEVTQITIMTASKSEEEILYKEFFENIAAHDPRVQVTFVVSEPHDAAYPFKGYIHDHINDLAFENSTVYMCGRLEACASLKDMIENKTAHDAEPQFLVEAFD